MSTFPVFRYADGNAAVTWLKDVFGLEEHAVYRDDEGVVMHAELKCGDGIIMLGQAKPEAPGEPTVEDSRIYVAVDDVDAHFERAEKAGARILQRPTDQDYGSRDYAAADLDGYVWCFGTYRP